MTRNGLIQNEPLFDKRPGRNHSVFFVANMDGLTGRAFHEADNRNFDKDLLS